jgi:hypothetical protein
MSSDTPDEGIPQDPGIPGFDTPSETRDRPLPDEKDAAAEERERPDDPDLEGHQTAPEGGAG